MITLKLSSLIKVNDLPKHKMRYWNSKFGSRLIIYRNCIQIVLWMKISFMFMLTDCLYHYYYVNVGTGEQLICRLWLNNIFHLKFAEIKVCQIGPKDYIRPTILATANEHHIYLNNFAQLDSSGCWVHYTLRMC